MFPKPSFNTDTLRQFIPSETAPGGNRKQRRAAFKKLPRAVRKGYDFGEFKETSINPEMTMDTEGNKTEEERIEETKALVETIYANHKHPKGRANNG